jgi:hypothetical protein
MPYYDCKNNEICRYCSMYKEIRDKILEIPYSNPFKVYLKCEYHIPIKTTQEV